MLRNIQKSLFDEMEARLSKKLGKAVKVLSHQTLSGGCINHAGKLETTVGTFFLKWNQNCQGDLFVREAESLRELSKACNPHLIIPEVVDEKPTTDTPAFLILKYLEPLNRASSGMDEKLGMGLAFIHQHTAERFGFYHGNYCGATPQDNSWNTSWVDFFASQRLGFILNLIEMKGQLPVSQIEIYQKLISKLPQLVPDDAPPSTYTM